MKIMQYQRIATLNSDDVFLVDGPNGTRKILTVDAVTSTIDNIVKDNLHKYANHRNIYRGKNLGTALTTTQKEEIKTGRFNDIWLGDYWTINGIIWRVMDFDYWLEVGDTYTSKHHLVVMPDKILYNGKMNTTSTTDGGYVESDMRKTGLDNAKTIINNAFGSSVLTHRELLVNAVDSSSGLPAGSSWYDSIIELPDEVMICGCQFNFTGLNAGSITSNYTTSKTQLSLMKICPHFIVPSRQGYWLRDIVGTTRFTYISLNGIVSKAGASNDSGVRPVFAVG